MKHFNYNPFTWIPKEGQTVWCNYGYMPPSIELHSHIHGGRFCREYSPNYGLYKTQEDAQLALETAREAIVNNVEE